MNQRMTPITRLMSTLIDLGFYFILVIVLLLVIDWMTMSLNDSIGLNTHRIVYSLPAFMLYVTYYLLEVFSRRSLGKLIVGGVIVTQEGRLPEQSHLIRRFLLKTTAPLFFFLAYTFAIPSMFTLAWAVVILYILSTLAVFRDNHLTFIDQMSQLSIIQLKSQQITAPEKLLDDDEEHQSNDETSTKDESNKATDHVPTKAPRRELKFPCAVELKVHTKGDADRSEELTLLLSQYADNNTPPSIKLAPKHGAYQSFKIVVHFKEKTLMQTCLQKVNRLDFVVMTIPIRSVYVGK